MKNKVKVLPVKQQLKWCDILQLPSDATDWSTIYKNNYYATNKTKLRSFQIRLNVRSIVTNVQLYVLNIASNNTVQHKKNSKTKRVDFGKFGGAEHECEIYFFLSRQVFSAFYILI